MWVLCDDIIPACLSVSESIVCYYILLCLHFSVKNTLELQFLLPLFSRSEWMVAGFNGNSKWWEVSTHIHDVCWTAHFVCTRVSWRRVRLYYVKVKYCWPNYWHGIAMLLSNARNNNGILSNIIQLSWMVTLQINLTTYFGIKQWVICFRRPLAPVSKVCSLESWYQYTHSNLLSKVKLKAS